MSGLVFEWDTKKAASNLRKHRASFDEAVTVFADPLGTIHDDPDHSEDEHRELLVGHSSSGQLLIVSFTDLPKSVRIISARRATRQERRDHEETVQE